MSSNPRNRNMVQQAAHASQAANLPSVPVVRTGERAIDEAFRIVKEILDVRNGAAGNPFERWVTMRTLQDLGLAGGLKLGRVSDDLTGVPVWTSRERFELVSPNALATLLQEFLATTASEVTAQDLTALRRSIALISPGLSATEVNQAIRRALDPLPGQWEDAIEEALLMIRQQLSETSATATQAQAAAAATAASASTTGRVALHLGARPRRSMSVAFDVDGVEEGDTIVMWPDPEPDLRLRLYGDEGEWDGLTIAARATGTNQITAYITANPGPVCGPRKFLFEVR